MLKSADRLGRSEALIVFFAAIYLAVLPMAETIAVRNLAMFGLLLLLVWRLRTSGFDSRGLHLGLWVPFVLWMAYICLFPIFAEQRGDAFRNLGIIWYHSILALLGGAGLALVLTGRGNFGTPFQLGVVSMTSIVIHLGFVGWKVIETSAVPWNYWGRESHHADLGYTAGQGAVLLAVALIAGKGVKRPWAIGLIAAALVSLIVAQSRAGLAFVMLGLLLMYGVYLLMGGGRHRKVQLTVFVLMLATIAAALVVAARFDSRWARMADRMTAGFYGDALQIQCEGTAKIEEELVKRYGPGERTNDLLSSIRNGDGTRIVFIRAGLQLALEHPWGLDGSRQAYQKRLAEHCPSPAAVQMAHTHNGWLDTILALGWIGAALYFLVLANFLRLGIAGLRAGGEGMEWAYVLVVLSIFWILRGFTDSVYRDHQLEMQGFVLAYAAVALKLKSRPKVPAAAASGVA